MDTYADDLSEFINKLDFTGAVLIGFSAGGGLPLEVFDRIRIDSIPDRSQLYEIVSIGAAALRSSNLVSNATLEDLHGRTSRPGGHAQ